MSLLLALAAVGSTALGAHAECMSVAQAAKDAGASSNMLAALNAAAETVPAMAALREVINSKVQASHDDQIAFFAPTDAAYKQASSVFDTLTSVSDLMLNHVVGFNADSEDLAAAADEGEAIETRLQRFLEPSKDADGALYITPSGTDIKAVVTTADIETCVGVMHIVDAVLVPSTEAPSAEVDMGSLNYVALASGLQASEIQEAGRSLLTFGSRKTKKGKKAKKGRKGKKDKRGKKNGGSRARRMEGEGEGTGGHKRAPSPVPTRSPSPARRRPNGMGNTGGYGYHDW